MTKSRVHVKIRSAVPGDEAAILEISRHIWSGHDYIPKVWDDWISDKNGRVLIATVHDVPVGVAHAFFQTHHDAWLEGVRVHPAFRGHGIAGKLNKALVDYAASKGAKVARLSTGMDNKASRRHLSKTGFKLLQSYARYSSKRPLIRKPNGVLRVKKYNDSWWKRLKISQDYEKFKGLYADRWTFYPLTRQSLREFVNSGSVFQTEDGSPVRQAVSIVIGNEEGFTIGYLSGTPDQLEVHARYARYLLSKKSKKGRIRVVVPFNPRLERRLRKSGFTRTGTILVYEKEILG